MAPSSRALRPREPSKPTRLAARPEAGAAVAELRAGVPVAEKGKRRGPVTDMVNSFQTSDAQQASDEGHIRVYTDIYPVYIQNTNHSIHE
jgi:hypothetical protein